MPEREYYGDELDDWLRDTGGNPDYGGGLGPPPAGVAPPPASTQDPQPDWVTDPNATPPWTIPGQEWFWNGSRWQTRNVQGPAPSGYDPSQYVPTTYGGDDGGMGGSARSGFLWPSYQQPGFSDPGVFDAGPAFSYKEFAAPTGDDVLKDPSFQFRLDQGRKALEASAAGRGVLRSGGTLKDVLSYGQNFGSQEYGNVWNRALQEYDTNRGNAADMWSKQYGQRQDVYGSNVGRSNALNAFNLNNAQFDFQGRQRQAESEFNDLFNRWLAEGNWTRDLAVGGMD